MKKGLIRVFIVLGILVAGLCIWAFAFGPDGGFNGIFKAFAEQVNNVWRGLTGDKDAEMFSSDTEIFGNAQNVGAAGEAAGVDW